MKFCVILLAALLLVMGSAAYAGEISAQLLTPRGEPQSHIYHSCNIYGTNNSSGYGTFTGASGTTGIIYHPNLPAGIYSMGLSEKDNYNVIYRKNLNVPVSGNTWDVYQYKPTAYCYGQYWFPSWHTWYAQSFRATGDNLISIGLRCAGANQNVVQLTIHDGDNPWAPQIGPARTLGVSSTNGQCAYWSAGEVPTVPGRVYAVKLQLPNGGTFSPWHQTVLEWMRSDNPDGRTWVDGTVINEPLEMTVNQDDQGLINTMCCGRSDGTTAVQPQGGFLGQTFTARGSSVLMVTWLGGGGMTNGVEPMVAVSIHDGINSGVVGTQIGPTKYCDAVYWDGRSVVTFSPNEVPTTPGRVYFVKLKFLDPDPAHISQVYRTAADADYAGGNGYYSTSATTVSMLDRDLTLGVYEEKYSGALDKFAVVLNNFTISSVTSTSARVTWSPSRLANGRVDYGETTPYELSVSTTASKLTHAFTLENLKPNTMYHLRGLSKAANAYDGYTKDQLFVTAPASSNLLLNPGLETGSFDPWVKYGQGDIRVVNGGWIHGTAPHSGAYGLAGAGLGFSAKGGAYQRVPAVYGREYRLSGWIYTGKDGTTSVVQSLQSIARIGIDPTGGTDPNSPNIKWTQMSHSHNQWTQIAMAENAASNYVTVFLYGGTESGGSNAFAIDDLILTSDMTATDTDLKQALTQFPDGSYLRVADAICTATPSNVGAYYVESEDRTCGLKVETEDYMFFDQRATLVGTIRTSASGERYLASAVVESTVDGVMIEPLCMRLNSVGGAAKGAYCPAVPGTFGPYNVGLLVRGFGKVTSTGFDHVYINDGSLPGDGLKVMTGSLMYVPFADDYVGVTGIVQLEGTSGSANVRLYPRDDGDVRFF